MPTYPAMLYIQFILCWFEWCMAPLYASLLFWVTQGPFTRRTDYSLLNLAPRSLLEDWMWTCCCINKYMYLWSQTLERICNASWAAYTPCGCFIIIKLNDPLMRLGFVISWWEFGVAAVFSLSSSCRLPASLPAYVVWFCPWLLCPLSLSI